MRINTAARVDDVRALALAIASGAALGVGVGGAFLLGAAARGVSPSASAIGASGASAVEAARADARASWPAHSATPSSGPAFATGPGAALVAGLRPAEARTGGEGRCLTQAVYYEARGESPAGQAAVAQVVLNRVRHPAYPKTVCAVVFQRSAEGCQFSFACNGALDQGVDVQAWRRAQTIATRALAGAVMNDVRGALMFQAASLSAAGRGVLAGGAREVAQIGAHIFYRQAPARQAPAYAAASERPQVIPAIEGGRPAHLVFASFASAAPQAASTPTRTVPVVLAPPAAPKPPMQPALVQPPPVPPPAPAPSAARPSIQVSLTLSAPPASEPS